MANIDDKVLERQSFPSSGITDRTLDEVEKSYQARVAKQEGSKAKPKVLTTEELLEERGKEYGNFEGHAIITQSLQEMFFQLGLRYNHERIMKLHPSAKEALHMIFHKLGRICNGNPENIDSWDDIAGYAKLEADRLRRLKDF